ncbi:MAG: M23 family metallopeptidase [Anaerolineales bacterium]|nr:M23 family metallopeptidase [Anaerolineales bacterium]
MGCKMLTNPYFMLFELILLLYFFTPETASAQQNFPRFLSSPYYGSKPITSWFDHEFPNYTTNDHLLKFTGEERDDPHDDGPGNPPGDIPREKDPIYDNCYDGHSGIDFSTGYSQILAAAGGIVINANWNSPNCHNCSLGLYIRIRHLVEGVTYHTYYGHLSTIAVQPGDIVKAGQVIGSSGSTGNSSGSHLHFEIRAYLNGSYRRLDPFGWQPTEDADPWSEHDDGAQSWCMWGDGQWVNYCDANQTSRPVPPLTIAMT